MADTFISYGCKSGAALPNPKQEKLKNHNITNIYVDAVRNNSTRVQSPDPPTQSINDTIWRTLPVYVLILLLAWAARTGLHDYALPFVANVDEPNMYLVANGWRGALDPGYRDEWLHGYPPGYLWLSVQVLNGVDTLFHPNIHIDMGLYIRILRLLSVAADMVTLAALMLTVRWLGTPGASYVAGALWSVSAPIVFEAVAAVPDSLVVMFCALALLFSLRAIKGSMMAFLIATVAGLIAIAFKYPAAPVLLLPAGAGLFVLYKRGRRALPAAVLAVLLVAAEAYGLLVLYGAQNLENREAVAARVNLISNLINLTRWEHVLDRFVAASGAGLIIACPLALSLLWRRRIALPNRGLLAWVGLTGALLLLVVPGYTGGKPLSFIRYTWPASLLFVVCASVVIERAAVCLLRSTRMRVLALALPILWLVPSAVEQQIERTYPDTREIAQAWFINNAPDGAQVYTVSFDMWRVLNRYEAGFPGYKQFELLLPSGPDWAGSPSDLEYIMLQEGDIWPPPKPDYPTLNALLPLKTFGGMGTFGPQITVYTPQFTLLASPITFTGEDAQLELHALNVERNVQLIQVRTLWHAPHTPPRDFSYFLHLVPINDAAMLIAQRDGSVGVRPTSTWDDPEERVLGAIEPLPLEGLSPGEYTLMLGVYYWDTGERLTLDNGASSLEIARFSIN